MPYTGRPRAVSQHIVKVWIEEGCISCSVCTDLVPDVFLVEDGESCVIRPDAAQHFARCAEDIHEAAVDCPVEVIKLESGD